MGRKILLAVVCCLAISKSSANDQVAVIKLEDNLSEATISRLYRNIPVGVYASAAPYAAYSFHVPKFIPAKNRDAVPVKEESVIIENTNAFLKDSYGNKFVNSPQALAYRTTFPQQFVQLQDLPAHLSQPLVSAAPTFKYKQVTPHFFGPGHIKIQTLQEVSPSTAHRYGVYQPQVFSGSVRSFAPASSAHYHVNPSTQQQQHPSNNQAVFANTHNTEQFQNLKDVGKFQRLEEKHPNTYVNTGPGPAPQITQSDKAHLKTAATITANKENDVVINLETKPPLPLLDLSLLEPLTFANPLVPQVQHFLPRINAATYHRLPQVNLDEVKKEMKQFVIQNTKSYDSGIVKGKPKTNHQGKNEKVSPPHNEDSHEQDIPTVTSKGVPNESPEFSYEINSPNYKETYKEQVVSYNKETQSEPVHYDYNEKTEKEPVHYSFVHKDPVQVKNVHYESNGQNEKHLVYNIKPEKKGDERQNEGRYHTPQQQNESEESPNDEPRDDVRPYKHHQGQGYNEGARIHTHHRTPEHREQKTPVHNHHHKPEHREEHAPVHARHHRPRHSEEESPSHGHHHRLEHREKQAPVHARHHPPGHSEEESPSHGRHHRPEHKEEEISFNAHHPAPEHREEEYRPHTNKVVYKNINSNSPQEYNHILPNQKQNEHFQPIITEYEEDIRLLPTPKQYDTIKVDPNQHIHHGQAPQSHNFPQSHSRPQESSHHHPHQTRQRVNHNPDQYIQEKSKRVIIKEEIPEERNNNEDQNEERVEQDERKEEDFEKGYKNAAFGFPAYEANSRNIEKEIYNPETYGQSRYHTDYDIEHTPFQQYQDEGDDFPKSTRANYKDAIDKTKEEYFLDYAISKPESIVNRFRHKEDYYKMFMKRKPQYLGSERENDKKNHKQNAKYTAAPAFEYHSAGHKPKQHFAKYKVAPQIFEYDYSKEAPKDNSAHSTRPHKRFKSHTQFVEPQFQYGFEPSALPRLLDSELAAMASNHSPESEKPGTRKKIYKENWYIKKTSTNSGKAS